MLMVPPIDDVEELLSEYPNETSVFLKSQTDSIIEAVTGETSRENIKYFRCSVGGDSQTAIELLLTEMIVSDPSVEGKETYFYAIINFATPVKLIDIANGTATPTIVDVTIEEEFEYNARLMFLKSATTQALIERVANSLDFDPDNSIIMIDFQQYVCNNYKIIILSGTRADCFTISNVPIGNTEKETIENIKNKLGLFDSYRINTLYNDIIEIEYVREEYSYKDIAEILEYECDNVKNNLKPILDYVIDNHLASTANLLSYRIAFGETNNGKISSIKLGVDYNDTSTNKNTYVVYNVTLPSELPIEALLDISNFNNLNLSPQNTVEEYSFTYDPTTQGDKDDFVKAVTTRFDENFNVEGDNVKLLYTF